MVYYFVVNMLHRKIPGELPEASRAALHNSRLALITRSIAAAGPTRGQGRLSAAQPCCGGARNADHRV